MSKRSRSDYDDGYRKHARFDFDARRTHDAAVSPIENTSTGTNAESTYDRAGIRDVITAAERGVSSPYHVGRDRSSFDIVPEDPLFFVSRRGGANTTQALVRSNGAGLATDAQREYENDPRQDEMVQLAAQKNTRFAGIALTSLRRDLGAEDHVSRLVAGIVRLRQGNMGKRAVVAGDAIVFRFPKPGVVGLLPTGAGRFQEGVPRDRVVMQAVPFEPLFVAQDLQTVIHATIADPEKYKRAMGPKFRSTAVSETAAQYSMSSALTTGILFARSLLRAGLININSSMANGIGGLTTEEQTALVDGASGIATGDVSAALLGEVLRVSTSPHGPPSRRYAQNAAARARFGLLRANALREIFHDPNDVRSEFGYVPGSSADNSQPKFKARYEDSPQIKRGDPYGDFAHEQFNHVTKAATALAAMQKELEKNVVATALTGASANGSGSFFAMLKM